MTQFYTRMPEPSDKKTWLSMWPDYVSGYIPTQETLEATWLKILDTSRSPHGLFVCNKDTDQLIGFIHYTLHETTWFDGFHCYLEDAYILPEYRGKRACKCLYSALRGDMTKTKKCRTIHWRTHSNNISAQKAYNRIAEKTDWLYYEDRLLETSIKLED